MDKYIPADFIPDLLRMSVGPGLGRVYDRDLPYAFDNGVVFRKEIGA